MSQNSNVKPSAEETEAMAANMLENATTQKSAIADTFIQQRDDTLKAVAESKQNTLGQAEALIASASSNSNLPPQQTDSKAAMEAAMKAANIPPPTEEELAILQAVLAQKQENQAQPSTGGESVEHRQQTGHSEPLNNQTTATPHSIKNAQVPHPTYPPSSSHANLANQLVMQEIALVIKDIITREVAAQVANISRIHDK